MIGTTISHYKILEKLGEGGMGIVYKAQDTNLDRFVALKFLLSHLATSDPERQRFIQEAKSAAALNHPNICTIYGIEEADDKMFIAMEYIDGRTLRELETFNSKLDTVVGYAVQIGEALQEAHSKGIVHRDIKADNIILTSKGQAKVMDFGLAKLKGAMKLTKTSSTVGTLGYMAPEQIQGGEVDHRSDIFSFGVLLFEMLTGKLPFRGEHEAAMLYSIVNEEALPLQQYVPDASSELIHVVNTALEKNAEERYQSASEMVRDLRRAQKQTSRVSRTLMTTGQVPTSSDPTHSARPPYRSRNMIWLAISLGVLIVMVAVALYLLPGSAVELNPDMTNRELQIPFTQIYYPSLSQDGKYAAFFAADENGKWDVYFTATSNPQPHRITNDSSYYDAGETDISPDGSQVAYNYFQTSTRRWGLRLIPTTGGESKHLCWDGTSPRWLPPEGSRIGYVKDFRTSRKVEFRSVRSDGNDDRLDFVDSLGRTGAPFSYSYAPDGKSVVWIRNSPDGRYGELVIRDLKTGNERLLTKDKANIDEVCWAKRDQILFSSDRRGSVNVWMASVSGSDPVRVTEGGSKSMRISHDGKKLLSYQSQDIGHVWLAGSDGTNPHQLTQDERLATSPYLSPDGKHIACNIQDPDYLSGIYEIYIMDRNGKNQHQRTQMSSNTTRPLWSPDGKLVACRSNGPFDQGQNHTYVFDPFDSEKPRPIGTGAPIAWANNHEVVIFDSSRSWIAPIDGKQRKQFYKDSTRAVPILGGRYILYADLRTSSNDIWIVPATGESHPQKIVSGLEDPLIVPNDKYLLFRKESVCWKISLPNGKPERLQTTFHNLYGISISYDGSEIVYVERKDRGKMVMYENMFK